MEESLKERPALSARQIRLVRFGRSEIDQRTRCEFTVADLDAIDLQYIAISYLWGDPTIVSHLECTQGIKDIPLTASAQKIVEYFFPMQNRLLHISGSIRSVSIKMTRTTSQSR